MKLLAVMLAATTIDITHLYAVMLQLQNGAASSVLGRRCFYPLSLLLRFAA